MAEMGVEQEINRLVANLYSHAGGTRDDLDRDGLVRLRGVVPPKWLAAARADIDNYLSRHGSGDHSAIGPENWECPHIAEFAVDGRLESFMQSLMPIPHGAAPGYAGWDRRVLRILDGTGPGSLESDWHYDSNAITMLVPIVIPDDGSGHLAMFPDHRPHRRWAVLSSAGRLFAHNKRYGRRIRRRFDRDRAAHTVDLVPGDVYLFRGYRALHSTLAWPPGVQRVTVVLQYGHPYGPDGAIVRAVRARRDATRKRQTAY